MLLFVRIIVPVCVPALELSRNVRWWGPGWGRHLEARVLINEERILIKEYIGRKYERTIGK